MLDVNVCPTCADPEITGADTNDGATDEDEDDTTPVATDVEVADPFLFVAVTTTRMVAPTSTAANRYD